MLRKATAKDYVAYCEDAGCLVNLAGRYDYLELPYYISQDLENSGNQVRPSCREMLDAYVSPLFLSKAKLAGLAVPENYITNGNFEPPVIVDTVNPFMQRSSIVLKSGRQSRVAKSMTRNYTYAICCQELPPGGQVKYFRSVMGWCVSRRFRELSERVWSIFGIPLARVRVVVLQGGETLLSQVAQLPFERLNRRELAYLQGKIQWGK